MFLLYIVLLSLPQTLLGGFFNNPFRDFMQCRLCRSVRLEGLISDCSCDFRSVDKSVNEFFSPILENLTARTFFRYFRVDLEQPCPFWHEDGQCMMESCSVCTCEESEVPESWMHESTPVTSEPYYGKNGNSFGWISPSSSGYGYTGAGHNDVLGRLDMSVTENKARDYQSNGDTYLKYLRDTEDDDRDWTDMTEDSLTSKFKSSPSSSSQAALYGAGLEEVSEQKQKDSLGVYVNLLQNKEGFTGYAGPSAARVWQSIQHENCFGGLDDTCVEKRVFYRLMSGLQASISTHIARTYYYPDGHWGYNIPLFVRAVGSHPDRLSNLYFTFLFVLRAVVKAGSTLSEYPFHTGKQDDDEKVRDLIRRLVEARVPRMFPKGFAKKAAGDAVKAVKKMAGKKIEDIANSTQTNSSDLDDYGTELEQCRNGFDESVLFQVPAHWSQGDFKYTEGVLEKQLLREEFRNRFRNITRIMDCVTCEKCKVWGKLQILGLGTAIKILLTPENELRESAGFLNRQEVIALINTLHQLTTSVSFAAHAADLEFASEIEDFRKKLLTSVCIVVFVSFFIFLGFRRKKLKTVLDKA